MQFPAKVDEINAKIHFSINRDVKALIKASSAASFMIKRFQPSMPIQRLTALSAANEFKLRCLRSEMKVCLWRYNSIDSSTQRLSKKALSDKVPRDYCGQTSFSRSFFTTSSEKNK